MSDVSYHSHTHSSEIDNFYPHTCDFLGLEDLDPDTRTVKLLFHFVKYSNVVLLY